MIGRYIGEILVWCLGIALGFVGALAILDGLSAPTAFGVNHLLSGCVLVALLMVFVQVRSAATAQASRDHATQRLLGDLIVAAAHPENRDELSEVVRARVDRQRKRHDAHRAVSNAIVVLICLAAIAGILWWRASQV